MAHHGSFLSRLARDKRGNTIAIMAAAMVPMLGLAGSAIDMTRLYVVKVRLQQACDAGVLAGRKTMTSNTSDIDNFAAGQAQAFFTNNFQNGWMKTSATAFTPTKTSSSQVSGTASTVVPMTIMSFFGFGNHTLTVACQAKYDVPDIDVLFVLDTTGSMACLPTDSETVCNDYAAAATKKTYTRNPDSNSVSSYAGPGIYTTEKTDSRIEALRKAVLSFYDALDGAKDPATKIRYGFVTYSSSVNAGKAIQAVIPNSMVGSASSDTATYQSRQVYADYTISNSDALNTTNNETTCKAYVPVRTPAATQPLTYDATTGTASQTSQFWYNGRCYTRTSTLGPQYEYKPISWPVAGLVAGSVIANPTKTRGQTMRWLGCVETNVETPGQSSFATTALPDELDPDITPQNAARWIPQLQDLVYQRNNSFTKTATGYSNGNNWEDYQGYGSEAYPGKLNNGTTADGDYSQKLGWVACGKPVKRLSAMGRTDVYNYVYAEDFKAMGGTYHDTGMIWGSRFISPTGPWAADTAAWPGRVAPNRVIIFLTDGDMSPTTNSYSLYGLEGYDRRVTNGDFANIKSLHVKRFLASCAAAKARNVDIWTVAIDTASSTELQTCATTTAQARYTTSGTDLGTIFADIAKKLAMLRLTV